MLVVPALSYVLSVPAPCDLQMKHWIHHDLRERGRKTMIFTLLLSAHPKALSLTHTHTRPRPPCHSHVGMGIENRFLFRTGSQWTDSLESLAKFFNDSVIDSLCLCACANLLIQTAANMLAFWITSDWGEWDWWWNTSSWEALLSLLSNTTVLVFRSSVSLGASG